MKHYIDFQYRPRHAARPEDEPIQVEIKSENGGLLLLPNIGDHVVFTRAAAGGTHQVEGVVENRLFVYQAQDICTINVVVTDSDTPWSKLIKE